jgi:hypothetical protein
MTGAHEGTGPLWDDISIGFIAMAVTEAYRPDLIRILTNRRTQYEKALAEKEARIKEIEAEVERQRARADAAIEWANEQLAAHPDAGEWTDAEYNDIINVDNHAQLRIVIDQSDKPDGKVHIHVRKRIVGEWAHVCVTTLKPEWRIQRRKQEGD